MAKKPAAIPVAAMTKNMDLSNMQYYENFTEEQIKAFSPWLAMRWASSVQDKKLAPEYITMVNSFCNSNFSIISKHPNLFWKLLCIVGTAGEGKSQYHKWVPPGKKAKKSKVQKFLAGIYPTYKLEDLKMLELVNSTDDLKDLARTYGMDDKDIKELFK